MLSFTAMPVVPGLAAAIKKHAACLGFDACGIAVARPVDAVSCERYRRWLAAGRHGCMAWAERYCDVRDDPRRLLDGARSIVMVAMNYRPARLQHSEAPQFAWYAYGRDYHEVLRERLQRLAAFIGAGGAATRCCVDTAPLRERYWAQQAGLGFIGRNNQLIVPGLGSYVFLGAVLTTLALEADAPCTLSCQGCSACIVACPTHALDADGDESTAVDARRCLSCLTIEWHGPLDAEMRRAMGNRVFGCDTCQHCCPHNAAAPSTTITDFEPSDAFLALRAADIAAMTPAEFSRLFAHSAVRRTKLAGLQRNLGG